MSVPSARIGRPRTREEPPGGMFRVELRLPESTAAKLYATARNKNSTVSVTVAALIDTHLPDEEVVDFSRH